MYITNLYICAYVYLSPFPLFSHCRSLSVLLPLILKLQLIESLNIIYIYIYISRVLFTLLYISLDCDKQIFEHFVILAEL